MEKSLMRLTAKTFHGLEPILAKELEQINAQDIRILNRAVQFKGDIKTIYSANYQCRTALRILTEIAFFKAHNEDYIYRKAKEIPWDDYMHQNHSFAINKTVNSDFFKHSHFVALRLKDAIADFFKDKYGRRPSVDTEEPDILINLHISDTRVNISLDTSGTPLYKRGYKKQTAPAPLNEVLAAGLILSIPDILNRNFYDPMCGSGTIVSEYTLAALNIPPGYFRDYFAFQNYPDYNEALFNKVKEKADAEIKSETKGKIFAADKNKKMLDATSINLRSAGIENYVTLTRADFFNEEAPAEQGIILTNPPYNERLREDNIKGFYKQTGDALKQQYAGWKAFIFSGFPAAAKSVGLRSTSRSKFYNGKIESRLLEYDIIKGSLKNK